MSRLDPELDCQREDLGRLWHASALLGLALALGLAVRLAWKLFL